MGLPNPSRETKFSGANAFREIFIFPVQVTTSRIGNLTRLIHTIAICVTIHIHSVQYTLVYRRAQEKFTTEYRCIEAQYTKQYSKRSVLNDGAYYVYWNPRRT